MTSDIRHVSFDALFDGEGWRPARAGLSFDASGDITAVWDEPPPGAVHVPGACLPGLCNLHSHAHQRAMAGLAEYRKGGDNFWTWRETMYAWTGVIEPDDLQAIAAQAYVEMLLAGYTRVGEFQYLHHAPGGAPYADRAEMSLACLRAATDAGIGMTCLPVLYRYGDFGRTPASAAQARFVNDLDGFLDIYNAVRQSAKGAAGANAGVAPHSLRAVDQPLLAELLTAVRQGPLHLHIAEQQKEVDACIAHHGAPPVRWLLDQFDVGPRWCLIHATHMTAEEIRALAASGAVAGLCPTTEANLGDGVFNAGEFFAAGGRFGIGSDSQIGMDPAEELRWLEYAQRLHGQTRNVLSPYGSARKDNVHTGADLYRGALQGGARALGHAGGRLAAGRRADFVVLDLNHPRLYARERDFLLDAWIFAGATGAVREVYVGGRRVVTQGAHAEQERVAADYRACIKRLAQRLSNP